MEFVSHTSAGVDSICWLPYLAAQTPLLWENIIYPPVTQYLNKLVN
jgi:hypothetical protein